MSRNQLTIKLVGPDQIDGFVDLAEFARFCDSVARCLKRSESILSGEPGGLRYVVKDLECASAKVTIQARRNGSKNDPRKVLTFFKRTVDTIQRNGKVDRRITKADLDVFKDLSDPVKHSKRVMVGRTRITESFASAIEEQLEDDIRSEGFVSGRLDRVNVHTRNEMALYPLGESQHIRCFFPDDLLDPVRSAIKRHVTVNGTLSYRPGEPLPYRVNVDGMEIHPEDNELPTPQEIRALGVWSTDGLTAVEFVRAIRDEEESA